MKIRRNRGYRGRPKFSIMLEWRKLCSTQVSKIRIWHCLPCLNTKNCMSLCPTRRQNSCCSYSICLLCKQQTAPSNPSYAQCYVSSLMTRSALFTKTKKEEIRKIKVSEHRSYITVDFLKQVTPDFLQPLRGVFFVKRFTNKPLMARGILGWPRRQVYPC